MRDEMNRYSAKLREVGNPPLEVRVGINTGETVVRSIKTGDAHTEYTPIGHSTSLASRMQTLAPTGSIAVTETTEKLCAGYFAFKPLGRDAARLLASSLKKAKVTPRRRSERNHSPDEEEWLGHANVSTTRLYDRRKMRPHDSPTFRVRHYKEGPIREFEHSCRSVARR